MAETLVRVDMSDEIEAWRSAVYGRQVRSAQISALQKTQVQVNAAIDYIEQKGDDIDALRQESESVLGRAEEINRASDENVYLAEAWAHGRSDHPAQESDNSKHWSERSRNYASEAGDSAKRSESWAIGGTGTRDGENANNSQYWSEESQRQAEVARNEADRAARYSTIVAPGFYLDVETGILWIKSGIGVDFIVNDGVLYWKITA